MMGKEIMSIVSIMLIMFIIEIITSLKVGSYYKTDRSKDRRKEAKIESITGIVWMSLQFMFHNLRLYKLCLTS